MAESLFTDADLVDANLNANDSQVYTLGTVVIFGAAGFVTHGRWRFPASLPSGSVSWVMYDFDTEAELARAVFASPVAGAWNTVALGSPVAVTLNQQVVVAVETPDRYVVKSGLFASALVSGSLTAPATSTVPNGRFAIAVGTFPTGSSGGSCYFADLVFDTGGGGPAQGSADAGLGLAVAAAGGRVSAGSAGLGAGLGVAAVGGRRSAGSGAVGLDLVVAAAGARPARGSAALELVLTADARSGRAVVSRPNAGLVVRPNTGVVVRP